MKTRKQENKKARKQGREEGLSSEEEKYQEELERVRAKKKDKKDKKVQPETIEPKVKVKKTRLGLWIAPVMILIIFGWVWSLKYSLGTKRPTFTEVKEEIGWQQLEEGLSQSLADIQNKMAELKSPPTEPAVNAELSQEALEKFKQNLILENTKDWPVYTNQQYKFSVKHPADWQVKTDKNGVSFSQGGQQVVIIIQPDIPRVPLPPEKVEEIKLDTLAATLYHDVSLKDGTPVDKVIADLPASDNDIYLAGYGEVFDQMVATFKFR